MNGMEDAMRYLLLAVVLAGCSQAPAVSTVAVTPAAAAPAPAVQLDYTAGTPIGYTPSAWQMSGTLGNHTLLRVSASTPAGYVSADGRWLITFHPSGSMTWGGGGVYASGGLPIAPISNLVIQTPSPWTDGPQSVNLTPVP